MRVMQTVVCTRMCVLRARIKSVRTEVVRKVSLRRLKRTAHIFAEDLQRSYRNRRSYRCASASAFTRRPTPRIFNRLSITSPSSEKCRARWIWLGRPNGTREVNAADKRCLWKLISDEPGCVFLNIIVISSVFFSFMFIMFSSSREYLFLRCFEVNKSYNM